MSIVRWRTLKYSCGHEIKVQTPSINRAGVYQIGYICKECAIAALEKQDEDGDKNG